MFECVASFHKYSLGAPGCSVVRASDALGAGGGVGSHPNSPIQRDARSLKTKTLETGTDNRQLPGLLISNLGNEKLED